MPVINLTKKTWLATKVTEGGQLSYSAGWAPEENQTGSRRGFLAGAEQSDPYDRNEVSH